jgi:hypothetical protein
MTRRAPPLVVLALLACFLLGSLAPVLTSAPAAQAASTVSFIPVADTYVRADQPSANFGTSSSVQVDGSPVKIAYLTFDLSSLAGQNITAATLRLNVIDSSTSSQTVKAVADTSWSETATTYDTRPSLGSVLATITKPTAGTWAEVDLTAAVTSNRGQKFSIGIDSAGSDGADFRSREYSVDKPQLLVQLQGTGPSATPTPTPTPGAGPSATPHPTPTPPPSGSSDPVIVAAGDIACGAGSSGASCKQMETSNLFVGTDRVIAPDAVLLLGDNQYESGQLADWNGYYNPSWGRTIAITYPAIGNHEYNDPAGGGKGYFDYFTGKFGGEGNTSRRPGARNEGYYSFDVGTWHLIALNSQCSRAGGCSTGSAQETWLRQDLAAHPNRCTLAYWHIPLYSSGGRAAPNTTALWKALYDHGADVVLASHDHIYERFAPQDAAGNKDLARGIRQFTVGTGGRNHTSLVTTARNSEVRDPTAFGVLRLTLRATSYEWEFVPVAGSTFRDSGTADCH